MKRGSWRWGSPISSLLPVEGAARNASPADTGDKQYLSICTFIELKMFMYAACSTLPSQHHSEAVERESDQFKAIQRAPQLRGLLNSSLYTTPDLHLARGFYTQL